MQAKALAGQRLAHGVVQPHTLAHVGVLVGLVEAEAAAPALLGALHRRFGMAHQHVGVVAVGRKQRHAHAAGQRELQAVDRTGVRHRVENPARRGLGTRRVGLVHQQRKLVAADARDDVALAQAGLQAVGAIEQHAVADFVAQAVVDLLEAVEVEQQQRQRTAAAPRQADRIGQRMAHLAAVEQAGQRIGAGQGLDALARTDQLGLVAKRPDPPAGPAAAVLWLRHSFEHLARVQRQPLAGLQQRGLVDQPQAPGVGLGVDHAAAHPVVDGVVLAFGQQRFGQAPDLREAAVEGADAAGQVGDQDAVGGGFQRGLQLGHQQLALVELALGLAAVVHHHQVGRVDRGQGCLHRGRQLADAPRHLHQAAAGVDQHGVRLQPAGVAVAHLVPEGHVLGRGDQGVGAAAQHRRLGQAQQPERFGIDGQHPAVAGADQPGRFTQRVEQGAPGRQRIGRPVHRRFDHGARAHAASAPCAPAASAITGSKKYTMRWRGDR